MSPTSSLRWGVIGPGGIARKFAQGLAESHAGTLTAAASRDKARAEAFLNEFDGGTAFGDYQSILDKQVIDAVYIATPHPFHAEWAIKAAEAGIHILCEKPVTMNLRELKAILKAARKHKVFFMEAFMYRCHPQARRIVEMISEGTIGELRHMRGVFGFDQGPKPEGRHQAKHLGGGGILDLGCYPVSMMRLIAGAAKGAPFANPHTVKAIGHLDEETGTDAWTTALLHFEGDVVGEAVCAMRAHFGARVEITGSTGKLIVTDPWFGRGELIIERRNEEPVTETIPDQRQLYTYECEAAEQAIATGQLECPLMSWDDSLGNMQVLDTWRAEIGLRFDADD